MSPTKSLRPTVATLISRVARPDEDVGRALDDHVGLVAEFAFAAQHLPGVELQPLRREGQQLQLRRIDRGEDRHLAQHLDVFLQQTHDSFPFRARLAACQVIVERSIRPRPASAPLLGDPDRPSDAGPHRSSATLPFSILTIRSKWSSRAPRFPGSTGCRSPAVPSAARSPRRSRSTIASWPGRSSCDQRRDAPAACRAGAARRGPGRASGAARR